jgi:hypothetical protein
MNLSHVGRRELEGALLSTSTDEVQWARAARPGPRAIDGPGGPGPLMARRASGVQIDRECRRRRRF